MRFGRRHGQQRILALSRQLLEQGLRTHGALLGIEMRLRHQAHRRVRLGVFGAAPSLMGRNAHRDIDRIAGVEAAVAAAQHVEVMFKRRGHMRPLHSQDPATVTR